MRGILAADEGAVIYALIGASAFSAIPDSAQEINEERVSPFLGRFVPPLQTLQHRGTNLVSPGLWNCNLCRFFGARGRSP
jgi:hypothetical protein